MSFLSAVVATPTLGSAEVLLRLSLAAALGGAVGLERELRERQAGLRTHLARLRRLGALHPRLRVRLHQLRRPGLDPTRIAAQIVTGIGFLGAGAIIRQGLSVRGLTTAATLWLVAAIGMATGAGYWEGALITTFGALLVLGPLRGVAFRALGRFRPALDRLLVEIPAGGSAVPVIDAIERQAWTRRLARGDAGGGPALRRRRRRAPNRLGAARGRGRRGDRRRARGPVDGVVRAVLCSRNRAQGTGARAAPAGLGRSSRSTATTTRPRPARPTTTTREKARFGRSTSPAGARRGLGSRGGRARRRARRAVGAVRARGGPAVAKLLGELEGVESREAQLRLRARAALAGRARAARHGRLEGRSPSTRRAARASATTRSSSRTEKTAPLRSSGTSGRRRTRTVPARPARCSTRSRP